MMDSKKVWQWIGVILLAVFLFSYHTRSLQSAHAEQWDLDRQAVSSALSVEMVQAAHSHDDNRVELLTRIGARIAKNRK